MLVDCHGHVIPEGVMGGAGAYGPEFIDAEPGFSTLRVGEHRSTVPVRAGMSLDEMQRWAANPQMRIDELDAKQIDYLGVTISPLFYLYWAEPEVAVPFAQVQNDALAQYCSVAPRRLFFQATLPLQDVDAAVAEVKRSVNELGARALNIGAENLGGREIDDPAFYPLWELAETLDVPLFIHPFPDVMVTNKKDDYNLSWIVGYTAQEMGAFCRLILGGVFDEFPRLKVYITHGGGFAPYQFGRLETFAPHMPGVRCRKKPREYLSNFYFDLLLHSPAERRYLLEFAGADHLLFGSNYGSPQDQATFAYLDDIGLSDQDRAKIAGENATELFKLEPSSL
jgi:predicted TIM-barrel fold metal-dependent hydrolase